MTVELGVPVPGDTGLIVSMLIILEQSDAAQSGPSRTAGAGPHRRSKLMGIGDSIGKAAENAMEDLAGTSEPADDAHAPEPARRTTTSRSTPLSAKAPTPGITATRTAHPKVAKPPAHRSMPKRAALRAPRVLPGIEGRPGNRTRWRNQARRGVPASAMPRATPEPPTLRGISPAPPGFPIRTPTSCGQTLPRGTRIPAPAWAAASVTAY